MRQEPLLLVAPVPGAEALAAAAALAEAISRRSERAPLVLDAESSRRWRPTLLATDAARARAAAPAGSGEGSEIGAEPGEGGSWVGLPAARGRLGFAAVRNPSPEAIASAAEDARAGGPLVCGLPAEALREVLERLGEPAPGTIVVSRGAEARSLRGLVAIELRRAAVPHRFWSGRVGTIQARRARAGLDPGGATAARAARIVDSLLGHGGQALPAVLGLILCALLAAVALAALGGAATAKGRLQSAADLAALSAARSMREDFPRLFVPALDAGGRPNPDHLSREEYLRRARDAAERAALRNGLGDVRVSVRHPDGASLAPLRVKVRLAANIVVAGVRRGERTAASAVAAAEPAAGIGGAAPTRGTGGGYSGPLVQRQGESMRPDVAAAFDRLAAAAARAGHPLVINSGYRSDAEQARLFEANPDPRWVARPGTSLHRCGTELDLGPPIAHGWLRINAGRFGFLRRYEWEPWHFGFVRGPEPCSAAAERVAHPGRRAAVEDGDGRAASTPLQSFVPGWVRRPLLRAAATHGVSAQLLAAQLMAESNFNPHAVSPAGARGIAQFMPGTAAAYGLDDPFDPAQAIDAQARLMADLLRRFGAPRLALAAYNAGPAPVTACTCIPPYPETQGYVARILGLLDGAAAPAAPEPTLEVRLIS